MCYGYEKGAIKSFEYTLEGGVLVFTTTSLLNNLCVTGANLDSLITNPLFWVACVLALILLIVIIKLIVKHVKYRIKFVTNGGTHVDSIRAAKGEYFVMPTPPVKDGYVFAGWFTDKALTQRFMGTYMARRKGFKLYAKWACPVTSTRLVEMYDALRDLMRSYKKESFKPLLGLTETEMIASMYYKTTHIQLNLAINPSVLEKEGIKVKLSKERKFAEIPTQIIISTEEVFATALDLTKRVLVSKGLQPIADYVPGEPSTEKDRANGFAYMLRNDRVAKTAEDYFELLRIAVKSYVMEEDNGKFKPGDKVTLARLYVTNEVACLHLPVVKGIKGLKASRNARFADTPVEVKILAPRDVLEAYALIDAVMRSNGFVKSPENANDLQDVKVPATNGFAYTLIF
ncbi:MAG: InlB B-repeat-containing protein [Clostridia bacterium]|nr:InlB B-repeat-containing protein [Clostridia bacterium]